MSDVLHELLISLASLGFTATVAFIGWQLGGLLATAWNWYTNRN